MNYTCQYFEEAIRILQQLDQHKIEQMLDLLLEVRQRGGRVFFLGVGGGAGHASHAVNDFRKIASIESYTPTDNASELTARINDDGWETSYRNWLQGSRLRPTDAVFVLFRRRWRCRTWNQCQPGERASICQTGRGPDLWHC